MPLVWVMVVVSMEVMVVMAMGEMVVGVGVVIVVSMEVMVVAVGVVMFSLQVMSAKVVGSIAETCLL
jgi:hypothetical protein